MFALGRVIGALTSSALLATSLVAITIAPAQAAIENCGIVTYDDSLYGSQTLTPTATNGMCILKFDGFASTYQSQEITNLRLPSFVSSIAVEGVGGGGSSAVNMTNWLNGYFSGFDNSYTLLSDSGGGGGGGANFGVSSFSVTSNYVFGLKPGNAGLYDPSFTESGNANWTSPYLGNDGGSTVFSYTSAGVTKSITANGGKAPLQGSENTGGTGGTVVISGVTGFNTANGTNGLSRSSNNPSPYGGTYRGYLSSVNVGAGGGSSANYAIGTRGQGYGSGGSGAFIEDGQTLPDDLGCYQYRWAPNCDGQPGSIALAYSPTNYYPVSWEPYSPLWFPGVVPVVGTSITPTYTFDSAPSAPSPTPSVSTTWYRCTGTSSGSLDNTGQATGCTQVSTASSYTPVSADLGYYLQAKLVATNSGATTTTITGWTSTTDAPVITVPSAPTLSNLVSSTPKSAKLAITASATWNASYSFSVVDSTSGSAVGTTSFDGTNVNVSGLTANTSYSIKLKQINAAGTSPASSQTLTFTTPLAVTAASAPEIAAGDYRVGKSISVTTPVWSGNDAVTVVSNWYYCTSVKTASVAYETSVSSSGCSFIGSGDSITLATAHAGRNVVVIQSASDSKSTTQYMSASVAVTGAQDAPTINSLSLIANSGTAVSANISLAAFTSGNSAITGVYYQYSTDGGQSWQGPTLVATSSTAFSISGLTSGTTYKFKFAVRNTVNSSSYTSTYSAESTSISMPRIITSDTTPTITGVRNVGTTLGVTGLSYSADFPVGTPAYTWFSCPAAQTAGSATSQIGLGLSGAGCFSAGSSASVAISSTTTGNGSRPHLVLTTSVSDGYNTRYFKYASVQIANTPSQPIAVTVTPASSTSVSVTFTAPVASGSTSITGYKYSIAAGPNFDSWTSATSTGAGTATTFTISGLTSGTQYKVKVSAVNSAGTGSDSDTSEAIRPHFVPALSGTASVSGVVSIGETLLADVANLSVDSSPSATASFQWYACDDVNDVALLGSTCSAITGANTNSYVLASTESQKYLAVKITYTNTIGDANIVSSPTTQVPGVPAAVTNVVAVSNSTSSLSVTYDLPSFTGAGPITSVEYQYAPAPFTTWSTFSTAPNFSGSLSISGLTSNTVYRVVIRANNAVGAGASSIASASVRVLGPTTALTPPTLTGTATLGQSISATEPSDIFIGAPTPAITNRSWLSCATARQVGDSVSDCQVLTGESNTAITLTSSHLGKYLVYQVSASNSLGSASSHSASSEAISSIPEAPTSLTLTQTGSGSISTVITPGSANFSPVTGFEYELDGSGTWISTGSGSATTFSISGLTNGQSYALRVRAINVNGNSLASAGSSFIVLPAPTGLSATHADSSVSFTWNAVSDAASYTVQQRSGSSLVFSESSSCRLVSATSCTVSGLENDTSYEFVIVANGPLGSSAQSLATAQITPRSQTTTLSALQFKTKRSANGVAVGKPFSVPFRASLRSYEISVAPDTQFITLTPVSSLSGQEIFLNGVQVLSNSSSANIAISSSTTTLTIEVKSVDAVLNSNNQAVDSYTVTVTRPSADMSAITNFIGSGSGATPHVGNYTSMGVANVSTSNIAFLNTIVSARRPADVASPEQIQDIVDAANLVTGIANGANGTAPQASDYETLGLEEVTTFSSAQLSLLNSLVSQMSLEQAQDLTRLRASIEGISKVFRIASGSQGIQLTVSELLAMGITGVTSDNLDTLIAAIQATAADGSEVDSLSEIQDLLNGINAPALLVITSSNTANLNTTDFSSAGVSGVISSNLVAVNMCLSQLSSSLRDSQSEIQSVVDAISFILSQTQNADTQLVGQVSDTYGIDAYLTGPSSAIYSAVGATDVAALSNAEIALFNSILGNLPASSVDTIAELNSLAQILDRVVNSTTPPSLTDFQALGLVGVTATNLVTVQNFFAAAPNSAKLTLTDIQLLIDSAKAAAVATSYANSTLTTRVAPTAAHYLDLGVSGVTAANVAALNAAIANLARNTRPVGSWVASASTIQALLNTIASAPVSTIANYAGTGVSPSTSQYASAGVVGVSTGTLSAVNAFIGALPSSQTGTTTQIQAVVDAIDLLMTVATAHSTTKLEVSDFETLGITGVTAANIAAVRQAISTASTSSFATPATLQALITQVIADAQQATNEILVYVSTTNEAPTLAKYEQSGLRGVSAANKAFIDEALAAARPVPTTLAQLQAIIDEFATPTLDIISTYEQFGMVREADFATIGVVGVSATNLSAIEGILVGLAAENRDSRYEVQAIVDSYNFVLSIASGGQNSAANSIKPSLEDYLAIGVNVAEFAEDSEAFDLFNRLISGLPLNVLSSPLELNNRARIVADLVRIQLGNDPLEPISVADLQSLGLAGASTSTLSAILSAIKSSANGAAGISALETVLENYRLPALVSLTVKLSASASKLTSAQLSSINSTVASLVTLRARTITVTTKITLPAKATKKQKAAITKMAAARSAAAVTAVKKKLAASRSSIRVVAKIQTTTVKNTNTIALTATR